MRYPLWYDRNGDPLNETPESLLRNQNYKRVDETTLPNGMWVSTVWLGLDHNFSNQGPPLIFETMVFKSKTDMTEIDMDRYATEADAIVGHQLMVEKYK